MPTRILIVDDHEAVIEGLRAILSRYDDLEVVDVASDGSDALLKVEAHHPHIVIMDLAMPQFNGIEATYQIRQLQPDVKIIVFTMHSYREFLVHLLKSGISAYVLKQNPVADICLAIEVVRRGGTYFSENASEFLAQHVDQVLNDHRRKENDAFAMLSLREREVFHLLADGVSVREAAGRLRLSPKTVETHKYHIMEKLRIRSMGEWTKEAIRRGVVNL
jgi:DNA-binding NarL/FixJ family response regulator